MSDGILTAEGTASTDWIVESLAVARAIQGVERYDAAGLVESEIGALTERLGTAQLLYVKGTTTLIPGTNQKLDECLRDVRSLDVLAKTAGRRFRLDVRGHADADGPSQSNIPLSASRASRVRAALEALQLERIELVSSGVGSTEPLTRGTTEAEKQQNRRVSLRVLPVDAPAARPNR
jgi:outer membrane protein OmpA-like peptidoglycan-associated protein